MQLDVSTQNRISTWLTGNFDKETKAEIQALQSADPKTLRDAFYTDLAFGTGGLRGLMGPGSNRINIYTIRKATLGLALYLKKSTSACPAKVVIGFDSRNHSETFAKESARVLAKQGIEVFLFQDLRPTPLISFACRHLQCNAAIMITASHNPAEYNGYKVYWADGGQIVPPHDKGIMDAAGSITNYDDIPVDSIDSPLIHIIGEEIDEAYIKAIRPLQQRPSQNKADGSSLRISFSSLHGTGITLAPLALKDWGFSSILLEEKQCVPDGNFPTVRFPNPEYPETLTLGIKHLQNNGSDILLVTDPDADRLGTVVMHKGKPVILNGNETASICSYYLCKSLKEKKELSPDYAVITTIVSTELLPIICKGFGVQCVEVLTGFKYIGEKIHEWEEIKGSPLFLFGAEESYGYLLGTHARDKDAIVSCCLLAEIALYAKKQNKTLIDLLHDIYREFGVFRESQYSIDFPPGKDGMDTIKQMMKKLRDAPPKQILQAQRVLYEDYLLKERITSSGAKETTALPQSDVLLYRFDDGSKIVIRPSGTEPKLKIYAGVRLKEFATVEEGILLADKKLGELIDAAKALVQ
ncbi:MAG: phospho-sugar mutase [Chlamydiae bacterium]|nr:phospho-sugar mutase [Chlamydiota bacterium]